MLAYVRRSKEGSNVMCAALRTFVIGAIVLNVGGLGPLSSAAHAHAAPAVGVQRALYRHAGVTFVLAETLGRHPLQAEVGAERAREALRGFIS